MVPKLVAVVVAVGLVRLQLAAAATFMVTNTDDSGAGSLRQAIMDADNTAGADTIVFAIPPFDGTVKTITPVSALPDVTDPVVIDGYTQSGSIANTSPSSFNGTLLIELNGASVGGSGQSALVISAGNSTVRGLVINGFGIGSGSGIVLQSPDGDRIEGCLLGTDPSGTVAVPDHFGIDVLGGNDHVIGGTTPAARNVISGNNFTGIRINALNGVTIQGNFIGTQADGTSALGNGANGVGFEFTGQGGPDLVGGTSAGAGNVIAFNGARGVVLDEGMTGVSILGNSIFSNGALGIDLAFSGGGVGVSPNDSGDADTGPNNLQNFPVLATPMFGGGSSIGGTLNSTPGHAFRIEVFANTACDPSGNGEGETFVGTVDTGTTDTNGDVAFVVDFGQTLSATLLTATATDLTTNDTSEFSLCPLPPTTTTTTSSSSSTTSTSTSSTTTTLPPICLGGTTISHAKLVLRKLGTPAGDEQLLLKGTLDFTAGQPATVSPPTKGAQLFVEDLGNSAAAVFDLTHLTLPVPPGARGTGCGPKDGWKKLGYKNVSGAIDPPTCPAHSAGGLVSLRFKDKRAKGKGIGFTASARGASIPAFTGPARLTVVLGGTVTESLAGECGVHAFEAAGCKRKKNTVTCK